MNYQVKILNDIVYYIHKNIILEYDTFNFEYKFNPDEGWSEYGLYFNQGNDEYLASIEDFNFRT